MVKPDFDRFSGGLLSGRAALGEVCGNSGAMSSKNNLSSFSCDPKNDSLHNYAVCYTNGSTVDHDLYAWRSSHFPLAKYPLYSGATRPQITVLCSGATRPQITLLCSGATRPQITLLCSGATRPQIT